jgi:hypothetical protein
MVTSMRPHVAIRMVQQKGIAMMCHVIHVVLEVTMRLLQCQMFSIHVYVRGYSMYQVY